MTSIISLIVPAFLMIIAVITKGWIFYVLAGFAWLLFAFSYVDNDRYVATILIILGLVCFAGARWDRG